MFSNRRVIDYIKSNFVPVAININIYQYEKSPVGDWFRKVAEQGHYAGRTKPTPTRQGLYVATADGKLLASNNSTDALEVLKMMQQADLRWRHIFDARRQSNPFDAKSSDPDATPEAKAFPKGGLILHETCRDLPRTKDKRHQTNRHNFDFVWFTAEEKKQLLPKEATVGFRYFVPEKLSKRFVRFHLVDQVLGECDPWESEHVLMAELKAKVTAVKEGKVEVFYHGRTKCEKPATNEVNPFSRRKIDKPRGQDLKIYGRLRYEIESEEVLAFDLLALGDRWGTALYNFRFDDLGPAPVGFAFELRPVEMEKLVQPKFLPWGYFY